MLNDQYYLEMALFGLIYVNPQNMIFTYPKRQTHLKIYCELLVTFVACGPYDDSADTQILRST